MLNKNKNGYTLIELLFVVVIIGLISTVAIVSFNNSRAKARDAKLLNDVYVLQKALDMYFDDHGEYPPHTGDEGVNLAWGMWAGSRYTGIKGDATEAVFKNAMQQYMAHLPNPEGYYTTDKGAGWNWWWGTHYSRIQYRLITNTGSGNVYWVVNNFLGGATIDWGNGNIHTYPNRGMGNCQASLKNCYSIYVRTETDTDLGNAGDPHAILSSGYVTNYDFWLF
ncbi:hypothetical protein CO115_00980 [Candidatus Falkowbacteria bacterium CG_4_9_14_3_um_filter_36_9]|uniref:Type II secretion system protein GspG C-terminal domain-containing protein n=2 Tax=Candidatus Falkowiibacteriota TaxID=1752728 RepID=A0A1J4T8P0_9BACT|nr:MAG: hypothetical protein AUJ27_03855 [Candidatus Falkowbacteria bacterium CG1_02_37_44]PIV52077.1 MAG: hypothetical protein COS18_00645 [Candidatus Falkowbacteria bacterium CG02_land_8_20_14_3_00_36_14]PIX11481.1 MAG: hypothetical protein COZ73_02565 [Candidatus Falkowbacteria bacterium CG_4_8_14_3_um_filter_36_11]PJA10908.1 MAG: hypothetical protein COX67_02575 [Candidatus Falkowbacteria bacterium CG_4_10_14_0_2_um_filter_36_22]PJB20590.1 MAG: hypothetical protein CO115_00980 [Candidatus F